MIFNVIMPSTHEFNKGRTEIREVRVPNEEYDNSSLDEVLELIFKYGQNDFSPKSVRSVSVGDIVEVDGMFFTCDFHGWTKADAH